MRNFFAYGDSWTYGSDLKTNDKTYCHHIENLCNVISHNRGLPGNSNGTMWHQFLNDIVSEKIKHNDIVFFCLTEPTRFTVWDDSAQSINMLSSYTPCLANNLDQNPFHQAMFKYSNTQTQAWYDTLELMLNVYSYSKKYRFQYLIGSAFADLFPAYDSDMANLKEFKKYVFQKINIKFLNKKFSDFMENHQYGSHADAVHHQLYAEYIAEHILEEAHE